jgi:hypothetical protein
MVGQIQGLFSLTNLTRTCKDFQGFVGTLRILSILRKQEILRCNDDIAETDFLCTVTKASQLDDAEHLFSNLNLHFMIVNI